MRALLLALLLAGPAVADTFVLVPGAFAGAWAWDGVAERLPQAVAGVLLEVAEGVDQRRLDRHRQGGKAP